VFLFFFPLEANLNCFFQLAHLIASFFSPKLNHLPKKHGMSGFKFWQAWLADLEVFVSATPLTGSEGRCRNELLEMAVSPESNCYYWVTPQVGAMGQLKCSLHKFNMLFYRCSCAR
jgi:hypothetical protein